MVTPPLTSRAVSQSKNTHRSQVELIPLLFGEFPYFGYTITICHGSLLQVVHGFKPEAAYDMSFHDVMRMFTMHTYLNIFECDIIEKVMQYLCHHCSVYKRVCLCVFRIRRI